MKSEKENFERRNQAIAKLLWYGTWCASSLIAVGMGLGVTRQSADLTALGLSGHQLVTAGVALFIFLPVARVMLMLILFLRERDYRFALISALVLSIIAAGIIIRLVPAC